VMGFTCTVKHSSPYRRAILCGTLAPLVLVTATAVQLAVAPAVASRKTSGFYDPTLQCTWRVERLGPVVQYQIDRDGEQMRSVSGDLPLVGIAFDQSRIAGVTTRELPSAWGHSFVDNARAQKIRSRWVETGAGLVWPCAFLGYEEPVDRGRARSLYCATRVDFDPVACTLQMGFLWITFMLVPHAIAAARRLWTPNGRFCISCGYEILMGQCRCPECGTFVSTTM
jgi:hypothetical protein